MLIHRIGQQYPLNQSRWALSAITLLLMVGALGGCVSSSSFEEVSKERDDLIKRERALASNTKLLRNKAESTEEKAARLKAELEEAQSQLNDVNKSLKENNELLDVAADELAHRQSELLEIESKLAESNKELKTTKDYVERTSMLYKDLVDELSSELEANQIKINEMKNGVTVNLSQDILFPSGSATLNKSGLNVIKRVSGKLKNIPHQIIVAGFTDNVPIKGELAKIFPSNWELAGARAASVVRLLESQGLDSAKLTAVSFGENQPVAS
ncbi:MAG: OmpA family protein, partial [Gammaproteobacteria bacterium]|nr:OmpA family protein [Gammaproteobacteria bacterium]